MQVTINMLDQASVDKGRELLGCNATAAEPSKELGDARMMIVSLQATGNALREELARAKAASAAMAPETAFAVGVMDSPDSFLLARPAIGKGSLAKLREWAASYLGRDGSAPAVPDVVEQANVAEPEPEVAADVPADDDLGAWPGEEEAAKPTPTKSGPAAASSGATTTAPLTHEDVRIATRAVLKAVPGGILRVREVMNTLGHTAVDDIPADQLRTVVDALTALIGGGK